MRRLPIRDLAGALLLFVLPAAAQVSTVIYQGKQVVPNQVILRLRSSDAQTLARVAAQVADAKIIPVSPSLGIHVLKSSAQSVAALMSTFTAGSDVVYAEPNYILRATATPNDSQYSQLWAMPKIKAPSAWGVTQGSTASIAAVIDTGIDYTHPDLAANVWSAPAAFPVTIGGQTITCPAGSHGFNMLTGTCDPMDDNSHGSHTAGTIGAVGNNTIGVAGVNWTARIMAVKFLDAGGNGTLSDALNAIEFVIQAKAAFASTSTPANVRILSASWGGDGFSQSFLDELNKAYSNNLLFVAAAGNDGSNNDTNPFYPAGYTAPNVVAVMATDSNDAAASFTNTGATSVHIAAPGVSILSTVAGGGYAYMSGTSMAAPHVSGAALLTLAACPALTTDQLKSTLLASVDVITGLSGLNLTGGRVNVANAIQTCTHTAVTDPCSATVSSSDWKGEYFGNMTLSGTALMVRDDGSADALNMTFGSSPSTSCGVPADQFSARWTKTVTIATAGTYTFTTSSDDGMRLYIDGVKLVDRWFDQSAAAVNTSTTLTAGSHTFIVEYYQDWGGASASVSWQLTAATPTTPSQTTSCTATVPSGDWKGEYFGNMTLSGTALMVRDDGSADALNMTFGSSPSTSCNVPANQFSARWTKTVTIATAGTYTFTTSSDDGMRLYIDGVKLIDRWYDQSASSLNTSTTLTAGSHTIIVEYYQDWGGASASVSWQLTAATPTTPSPTSCSATVPSGDWKGEYFGNMTLSGTALMVRDDGSADALYMTFGSSPSTACNVPANQFSARWTKTVTIATAGTYTFTTSSDDGMRLYIDGVKLVDRWYDQSASSLNTSTTLAAGSHTIIVEYYQDWGGASAFVSWQLSSSSTPSAGCTASVPSGDWKGEYFSNISLSGSPVMVRDDGAAALGFDWGYAGSPNTACGLPGTQFSVRWTRTATFNAANYTFTTSSDDGIRVYLDGTKFIDRWYDQAASPATITVPVTSGSHTIVVEYYQDGGYASAAVKWQ